MKDKKLPKWYARPGNVHSFRSNIFGVRWVIKPALDRWQVYKRDYTILLPANGGSDAPCIAVFDQLQDAKDFVEVMWRME
jgi:hypothetical protein